MSSQAPTPAPQKLPRALTRTQLTAGLILLTVLPVCFGVALYVTSPASIDPVLRVDASVGPRAWPSDLAPDARVVPCVILNNPTNQDWVNVNLSINEQFFFAYPETIRAGEEIFIPLKFFQTRGNQYYPPESYELKLLTVYAQIPSGARAIAKIPGDKLTAHPRAMR